MSERSTETALHALTGVRPTGDLTIANYLGAIQPIAAIQDSFAGDISVFVADIHGLTDQEPDTVRSTTLNSARALLAAGINPERSTMFLQEQAEPQTLWLANILERHASIGEIGRVPTLKEKLRGRDPSAVSMSLFRYPVLMAADIAIQGATHVPVGEDQMPHVELTRELVRRFNRAYGSGESVLVEPSGLVREPIRVIALQAQHGKMSKSHPQSALLLRDDDDTIARKIKKAQTAPGGEMPPVLASHFLIAERLSDGDRAVEVARLKTAHLAGEAVMGSFKSLLTDTVINFLRDFRERQGSISDEQVKRILREGGEIAAERADATMLRVRRAMGLLSILDD